MQYTRQSANAERNLYKYQPRRKRGHVPNSNVDAQLTSVRAINSLPFQQQKLIMLIKLDVSISDIPKTVEYRTTQPGLIEIK